MANPSTDSFLTALKKSELLEAEKLRELLDDLQSSGVDLTAPKAVASSFVKRGVLTKWQAENLLRGKHRGYSLGKYRLLSLLGKGGMSAVYLAEHTLMRRRCAIKVLPAKRVGESSYLGRFHREAQAVASLDHPNIVRAYDVDHAEDRGSEIHFLVMEFVEGRDLQIIVDEDGPLGFAEAAEYVRQSADGLHHAHESGLIHRDVKPANLLVDPQGVVKILDMGLARFFDDQDEIALTVANDEKVLGTADYLAPEQAVDSHTADARADQYGLGCSMYFLLCGHPPFNDGTLTQRLLAHQTKTPPPIAAEREGVPASLVAIVERMMQKDPKDRYATMADVAEALETWLDENGGTPESIRRPATSDSAARKRAKAAPPKGPAEPAAAEESKDTVSGGDAQLSSFLGALDSAPKKPHAPKSSKVRRRSPRRPSTATAVAEPEEAFPTLVEDVPVAEVVDDPGVAAGSAVVAELATDHGSSASSVVRRPASKRAKALDSPKVRMALAGAGGLLTVLLLVWVGSSLFGGGGTGKSKGTGSKGVDPNLRELVVGGEDGHFATLGELVAHLEKRGKDDESGEPWMVTVTGGTYTESLHLSSAKGFPSAVMFETDGDPVTIEPPAGDDDEPVVVIEGVEELVLRGFTIDAGDRPAAVCVSELCPGVRLDGLELRHAGAIGVQVYGGYAFDAENPVHIRNCRFDGKTGVLVQMSDFYQSSNIAVSGCRFSRVDVGVKLVGTVQDVDVRENVFQEAETGLEFQLVNSVAVNSVVGNNTFLGVDQPIHFDVAPTDNSKLVVSRNLFVEQAKPELTVTNARDKGRFDRFDTEHNWSSRKRPGPPAGPEVEVCAKPGRRGVSFDFVSTKPLERGFLQPKGTAPHASVKGPKHGLKPYLGAIAP